jgi:hypothetical protein
MSDETPQAPASAFAGDKRKSDDQQENKAAGKVNPASTEAQELRETGMRPVTEDDKDASQGNAEKETTEGAPPEKRRKSGDDEKTPPPAETPPAQAAKEGENPENIASDQVGNGEEVAGLTQLAAERASVAAAQAKEAAVAAAATAANATKEAARKVCCSLFSPQFAAQSYPSNSFFIFFLSISIVWCCCGHRC